MTALLEGVTTDTDLEVISVTFSHTVPVMVNGILIVNATWNNRELQTVDSVTFDGVDLVFIGQVTEDDDTRVEQWRMIDPPAMTADVVITLTSILETDEGICSAAMNFSGVDQTTPIGNIATASDSGSGTASVDISSSVGELVLDGAGTEDTGGPLTVGAGQTQVYNLQAGVGPREESSGGSTEPGAATVTMSWTLSNSDRWGTIAMELLSAAAATPPTVDAGGPYNGDVDTAIALDATVTPGTDPTPVLLWTIFSGPGGGVFSNDAIEDPTFTPDTVGSYVLQLSADPSDGPPVLDTANLESDAVPPTVDAGGPYNGDSGQATALNATVTPGSDPAPALLWTIDSGGAGTFLPSATVEDPTFTPTFPTVGPYTLRLTVTPSDGPPVFDTAAFESDPVAPIVDAGGPYAGDVSVPIALNGTVTPGTDPAPTLLWTIDSGGTGTFSDDTAEDPTFTADGIGAYVLRLTVTPSDGPDVFDTAALTTAALADAVFLNGRFLRGGTGDLVMSQLSLGADPNPADLVYIKGTAHMHSGPMYVAEDDGAEPRVFIAGIAHQHNGVRLVTFNPPVVNLNTWGLDANGAQGIATSGAGLPHEGVLTVDDGTMVVDGVAPTPPPPTAPPALPDLQHWFDYTDASVVFADLAGVVPITLGTNILRVNNKGYEVDPLLDNQSVSIFPDWELGTNGQNVARCIGQSHSIITSNPASVNGSGVAGIFSWMAYKVNTLSVNAGIAGNWGNFGGAFAHYGFRGNGVTGQHTASVGTAFLTAKAIVTGEWVLAYSGNDTTNTGRYFVSGVLETTIAETYVQVPPGPGGIPGNSFTSAGPDGDTLMWGVYDRMLTPAEIGVLIAYIDNKLGTALPFIG